MTEGLKDPNLLLKATLQGEVTVEGYKVIPWDVVQATVGELIDQVERLNGELGYYIDAYGEQ